MEQITIIIGTDRRMGYIDGITLGQRDGVR